MSDPWVLAPRKRQTPFAKRPSECFAVPVQAECLHRNPVLARTYGHLWRCVWCGGVFRALKTPERASYFADALASAHMLHYDCGNAAEVLHFDCMRERRP